MAWSTGAGPVRGLVVRGPDLRPYRPLQQASPATREACNPNLTYFTVPVHRLDLTSLTPGQGRSPTALSHMVG